jgi:hypothetical protein
MTADAVRSLAIRVRNADPGHASLKSAARAAIVIPAVFAIADKVIANPQTSTLAAFGSFAMLVLVEFGGPWRARLAAYVTLAVAGAGLVVLGTLCSRNAWLSAGAMLVVGFAILFSGAINGYFAAGGPASILAFVLPVTIPAPLSAIPTRLEGWLLAAGVAIVAHFVLWPGRPPDGFASGRCASAARWRTPSRLSSPPTASSSPRPPRRRERPSRSFVAPSSARRTDPEARAGAKPPWPRSSMSSSGSGRSCSRPIRMRRARPCAPTRTARSTPRSSASCARPRRL